MNFRLSVCLLVTVAGISTVALGRDDPNQAAIKARNGEMQLRSFNAGPLFAMAKGNLEYDAELASKLAGNLQTLLKLDTERAWPKGSSLKEYPGETTAKPSIWTTFPEVAKYGKKYEQAVNNLNAEAGNGLSSLRKVVGPLGQSCKACHDEFRKKD